MEAAAPRLLFFILIRLAVCGRRLPRARARRCARRVCDLGVFSCSRRWHLGLLDLGRFRLETVPGFGGSSGCGSPDGGCREVEYRAVAAQAQRGFVVCRRGDRLALMVPHRYDVLAIPDLHAPQHTSQGLRSMEQECGLLPTRFRCMVQCRGAHTSGSPDPPQQQAHYPVVSQRKSQDGIEALLTHNPSQRAQVQPQPCIHRAGRTCARHLPTLRDHVTPWNELRRVSSLPARRAPRRLRLCLPAAGPSGAPPGCSGSAALAPSG